MPKLIYVSANRQSGFAMIEVLVTAIIFAIGISGMGVLLLKTIQGTQDNAQRSQGMWIIQDFVGRIRANPEGAKARNYEVDANPDCTKQPTAMCADHIIDGSEIVGVDCSPENMAEYDIWVSMCGFDTPPADKPDDKIFDSPAEFVVSPELRSTCDAPVVGTDCLQYTVSLTWKSKIAKGSTTASERNTTNTYQMVVELN